MGHAVMKAFLVAILLCACECHKQTTTCKKLPNSNNELYDDIEDMLTSSRVSMQLGKLYEIIKKPQNQCLAEEFYSFPKTIDDYKKLIEKNNINFDSGDFGDSLKLYQKEATIVDFQNDGLGRRCSYEITRNPIKNRLVVIFRGTCTPMDVFKDARFTTDTLDVKEIAKHISPTVQNMLLDKKITLHKGFREYMFKDVPLHPFSAFDMIENKLATLMEMKENKGYEIYITGHSLGGALATLAGFALAMSDNFKQPIKLITFASPQPGRGDLADAIEELGDMGRIYHCRVTNNNDYVPQIGVLSNIYRYWQLMTFRKPIESIEGYRHSGVHLNLFEKKKPTFTQSISHTKSTGANGMKFSKKIWNVVNYHKLHPGYSNRFCKDDVLELLKGMTWEDLKRKRGEQKLG